MKRRTKPTEARAICIAGDDAARLCKLLDKASPQDRRGNQYLKSLEAELARVHVLAPIGTAMLGYRVGDALLWQVPDGERKLLVKEMLHQLEASGDYHL